MLNIKNYTMVSLPLQHPDCNWYKKEHSRSVSQLLTLKEFSMYVSSLCFLIVEVRWGRALSFPRPTNLGYQNIISSPGLQKDSANLPVFSLLTCSNPLVLEGYLLVKGLNSSFLSHTVWFICRVCVSVLCVHFSNFVLSTSTFMCTHFLIFMWHSDWGKDQTSLPFTRHKTLNLTSMATKIIGSPETKWIDATSGIYSSEKASNLSVTTDFSESLQSSVSILRSVSNG